MADEGCSGGVATGLQCYRRKKNTGEFATLGCFDFWAGTSDAKSAGIRRKGRGMNPFLLCIQQNAEPCKFFSVQRKFFR